MSPVRPTPRRGIRCASGGLRCAPRSKDSGLRPNRSASSVAVQCRVEAEFHSIDYSIPVELGLDAPSPRRAEAG